MKKRLLSIVFALLMLCQLLSFSILASDVVPDENETPDIGWENVYKVTLPEAPVGYTITVAEGSSTTVEEGGSFSFTVTVDDGYKKGDNFAVLANDVDVTSTGVNDVYTITVTGDVKIKVEGVEAEASVKVGDIDGNGEIVLKDVILLSRHVAGGYTQTVVEEALDIDGNGEVVLKDVILLSRYVAGGYGVELP